MKLFPVLSASAVLGLAACDTMNAPISHNGFDPLLTPGAGARSPDSTPAFKAGDLARAVMDNTFFFKKLPKGGAEADKTLLRGTGMKVTRVAGSYLEVELDVTGETGYVPAVMVENASIPVPGTPPGPGPTQLYPPLPGGPGDVNPIPPLDPRGLPPDGAIPTVIDPPTTPDPVPVPTPDAVPAPVPTPGAVSPPVPPAPEATPDPVPPIEPKPAVPEKPKAEAPEETPIGAP
jgi:hypothetical protein